MFGALTPWRTMWRESGGIRLGTVLLLVAVIAGTFARTLHEPAAAGGFRGVYTLCSCPVSVPTSLLDPFPLSQTLWFLVLPSVLLLNLWVSSPHRRSSRWYSARNDAQHPTESAARADRCFSSVTAGVLDALKPAPTPHMRRMRRETMPSRREDVSQSCCGSELGGMGATWQPGPGNVS